MTAITMMAVRVLTLTALTALMPGTGSAATDDSITTSLVSAPVPEDTSVLNRRLLTAKSDLEQFLAFAEHFAATGESKAAEQLRSPVDDFLKRHVDPLLAQTAEQANLETTRMSAEVMYVKSRLFLSLNRPDPARVTVAEMKKRFGPYQNQTVQVEGRSTTLTEAIRMLDEDLTKTSGRK